MSPKADNCCFCIPLRTGCFLIGVFLVVFSSLGLITSANLYQTKKNEETENQIIGRNMSYTIIFAVNCIEFAFGILILYATYKWLADWLRFIAIAFLVYILLIVLMGLLFAIIEMNFRYLGIVFWFFMRLYFILVIWSYHSELLHEYSSSDSDEP